jgi:hypothetical protein
MYVVQNPVSVLVWLQVLFINDLIVKSVTLLFELIDYLDVLLVTFEYFEEPPALIEFEHVCFGNSQVIENLVAARVYLYCLLAI